MNKRESFLESQQTSVGKFLVEHEEEVAINQRVIIIFITEIRGFTPENLSAQHSKSLFSVALNSAVFYLDSVDLFSTCIMRFWKFWILLRTIQVFKDQL